MIAKVDPGAGLGDRRHLLKQRLERIGGHQIRNKGGDAADRRRAVSVAASSGTRGRAMSFPCPRCKMDIDAWPD
jgi:hypothetical protein